VKKASTQIVPFTLLLLFFSYHPAGAAENPEMVFIPRGEFMAGKPGALKPMALDAFYIDRHEVTQAEYKAVTGKNPSYFKSPQRPVEKVTWFDAKTYCEKTGKRLPTEWEWEKAAKAGTVTRYYWGDRMDGRFAWYRGNAGQQTHPVAQKQPNAFGLYDMSGNVWEWTSSDHDVGGKVQRGGSWRNEAISQQSAHRILSLPIFSYHYVGFRCARSPTP